MEVAQINRKMERLKSVLYYQPIAESTEVETHFSIKFSKKKFGGILKPKSVR